MTSERIPLASLTSAELDADTLAALFSDLAELTQVDEVLIKGAPGTYAGVAGLTEAARQLASGARGVQIRYVWQTQAWCDTLIQGPAGVRLVRNRIESEPQR